ncbi:hypothetical protein BDC45DRAFT_518587 [Circinella umbellata]|nr:hypothetical protein BDC45DRAFT_518587 [Circinella umbellata]
MVQYTADETGEMHSDASITNLERQRDFGPSLEFGKVKLARMSPDNHSLCHDLLRLGNFAKDRFKHLMDDMMEEEEGTAHQLSKLFTSYRPNVV